MEFFDNHAHLDDEKFDEDRSELIEQIYNAGITKMISAGYNVESSKKASKLANEYEFIYYTVGISPNDIPQNEEELWNMINQIKEMINQDKKQNCRKLVAIGEIGLDYYWNKENKDLQKLAFIKQIELANELNLPIVIHTRKATEDTLQILRQNPVKSKGVFHCCSLKGEQLKDALELGFYISFAGPITFKNSKNVDEVVNLVPNNRILIETDSPYLSPEPFRGQRNDPRNVKYVAQKIANSKNMLLEEIAQITYENAKKIFNIKDNS